MILFIVTETHKTQSEICSRAVGRGGRESVRFCARARLRENTAPAYRPEQRTMEPRQRRRLMAAWLWIVLVAAHADCSWGMEAFVTAASSSYFDALENLIGSIHKFHPDIPTFIYDLGLTQEQGAQLQTFENCLLHPFAFDQYPPHVRNVSNFAWKPIVIKMAVEQAAVYSDTLSISSDCIFYLDAGMEVRSNLGEIFNVLHRRGHWFVGSSLGGEERQHEVLGPLVHHMQYQELGLPPNFFFGAVTLAAGMIGVCHNTSAWQEVFVPWLDCSLRASCIAPPGSSTANHRFDQSALSILFHRRNQLYAAKGEEELFRETSHLCWISRSIVGSRVAQMFERPSVRYSGIYFYARRSHKPKPFRDFVLRRIGTTDHCDDSMCTSQGDDCCAPLSVSEAATCKDAFIPVRTGQACGGYSEGVYRCCKSSSSSSTQASRAQRPPHNLLE